jgi:hypothetical protein
VLRGILKNEGRNYFFCSSPPGGSDARDAFRHAVCGDMKKNRPDSSASAGEALQENGSEQWSVNEEPGMPTRSRDKSPKKELFFVLQPNLYCCAGIP